MMTVKEKLNMDGEGLLTYGPINIVAFGDSVTHGCLATCIDYESVYWNRLKKKLNAVRDSIPVNAICAGIGGAHAANSIERIDRDVLSHHPELVIVCFGLNDVNGELEDYINALTTIFNRLKETGCEVIFMTPNMLNTRVLDDVDPNFRDYAFETAEHQNNGRMDRYMEAAKEAAEKCGAKVCDCYGAWKKLAADGVDVSALLCNRINHPSAEMHQLFADMLFDTIMGEETFVPNEFIKTMDAKAY